MRRVSANKNALSSRLNSVRQMSCCRSSAGRLFHSRGPAALKLLSPSLDCVRGTVHVWTSADRRCRRPTSVTSWQSSDRYAGKRRWSDLYTSTMTLKSIRCLTQLAASEAASAPAWCALVDQLQWPAKLPHFVPTAGTGPNRRRCRTEERYSSPVYRRLTPGLA